MKDPKNKCFYVITNDEEEIMGFVGIDDTIYSEESEKI